MDTLTLPTVPAHVIEARLTFHFQVTPDVLRQAQTGTPFRGPEASLRALGHDMAAAKREAFRAGTHPDLPDEWVRSEVELLRVSSEDMGLTVRVSLTVEPPELLGVWEASPGSSPELTTQRVVSSETWHLGYCTVDGRPVYSTGPAFELVRP